MFSGSTFFDIWSEKENKKVETCVEKSTEERWSSNLREDASIYFLPFIDFSRRNSKFL